MSIVPELKKASIEWSIDQVEVDIQSQRNPEETYKAERIRVQLTDVGSDSDRVTVSELFSTSTQTKGVEELLARTMRKHFPKHPVFLSWMQSRGHCPVTIDSDLLKSGLGECLHTALRKAVDGPQSVLQWNAIHYLMYQDWHQLLEMTREEIKKTMALTVEKCTSLTYYNVGMAIREAFVSRMEEVTYRGFDKTGKKPDRTEMQAQALRTLDAACELTDNQDFVWGWTAYLCKEVKESKPTIAPACI